MRIWPYFLFLRAVINIPIKTLIISPWLFFRKMIISKLELGPLLSRITEKSSTDKHSTETSIVVKTKECASLYVRKLGAAGIAQILLVVVNILVAYKSVASEARLNISHQRRDLLATCFLVFFIPFYLSSLLWFQIQPFHKVCKMRLNRISYCFQWKKTASLL